MPSGINKTKETWVVFIVEIRNQFFLRRQEKAPEKS